MRHRYYICDVFTDRRFGGNPLAVLPEAAGLSDARMQQIAREFNFSGSSFVFRLESGHPRRVRIFTPKAEVPFRRASQYRHRVHLGEGGREANRRTSSNAFAAGS